MGMECTVASELRSHCNGSAVRFMFAFWFDEHNSGGRCERMETMATQLCNEPKRSRTARIRYRFNWL